MIRHILALPLYFLEFVMPMIRDKHGVVYQLLQSLDKAIRNQEI